MSSISQRALIAGLFALLAAVVVSVADKGADGSRSGGSTVILAYAAENVSDLEGMVSPEESVERKYLVSVTADGNSAQYSVSGKTVSEVLEIAGIALGKHDVVNLPLERRIDKDADIVVERRSYVEVEREEEIPCQVLEEPTCLLMPGKSRVLAEGQPGLRRAVYRQLLVDGEVAEETLVGETVLTSPVTRHILVGSDEVAISPLDFGYELDEDGVPVGYTGVLKSQVATGYSARGGAKTASGRYAVTGHVAVNPKVIPYGTKLFIQSADGRFVYGYAIAADTGVALLDGRVNVDLFYDTYLESALNGRRTVDIYILEDEPPAPEEPEKENPAETESEIEIVFEQD